MKSNIIAITQSTKSSATKNPQADSLYNISLSLEKCPPRDLPDLIEFMDEDTKKNFKAQGCSSTYMRHIERMVITRDQIHTGFMSSSRNIGRWLQHTDTHIAALKHSFQRRGWQHEKEPLFITRVQPADMERILRDDPSSKMEYQLFSGRGRNGGLGALSDETQDPRYNELIVDRYEYNNRLALEVHGMILNTKHSPAAPLAMADVISSFSYVTGCGLFSKTITGWNDFRKLLAIDDTFDSRTIPMMGKKALKLRSYKASDGLVLVIETGRSVAKTSPRHVEYRKLQAKVPYATGDARLTGLLRDEMPYHLKDGTPKYGKPIYITLFVEGAKCVANPQGLKGVRTALLKDLTAKIRQLAEWQYLGNLNSGIEFSSSHPLAPRAPASKKDIIEFYEKTCLYRYNGFMPQLITENGDPIENVIVNADGTPFEKFVSTDKLNKETANTVNNFIENTMT